MNFFDRLLSDDKRRQTTRRAAAFLLAVVPFVNLVRIFTHANPSAGLSPMAFASWAGSLKFWSILPTWLLIASGVALWFDSAWTRRIALVTLTLVTFVNVVFALFTDTLAPIEVMGMLVGNIAVGYIIYREEVPHISMPAIPKGVTAAAKKVEIPKLSMPKLPDFGFKIPGFGRQLVGTTEHEVRIPLSFKTLNAAGLIVAISSSDLRVRWNQVPDMGRLQNKRVRLKLGPDVAVSATFSHRRVDGDVFDIVSGRDEHAKLSEYLTHIKLKSKVA